ncbi:hypothetical protein V8C26DRAFT_281754 [Trichoderma gracile]
MGRGPYGDPIGSGAWDKQLASGGSCGGNCVEEEEEPRIREAQEIASVAERFMLVAQALTDPLVPRTFCCRFTLLELASCMEEGPGLAGTLVERLAPKLSCILARYHLRQREGWERHGSLVQVP